MKKQLKRVAKRRLSGPPLKQLIFDPPNLQNEKSLGFWGPKTRKSSKSLGHLDPHTRPRGALFARKLTYLGPDPDFFQFHSIFFELKIFLRPPRLFSNSGSVPPIFRTIGTVRNSMVLQLLPEWPTFNFLQLFPTLSTSFVLQLLFLTPTGFVLQLLPRRRPAPLVVRRISLLFHWKTLTVGQQNSCKSIAVPGTRPISSVLQLCAYTTFLSFFIQIRQVW